MPAPFFTSNPSEITRLEGLYISEKNPPGFITGVSLNTVGVAGRTLRGPVDKAIEVSSAAQFVEIFGERASSAASALVNQVWRFLLNKQFGKVVVVRAAAADATTSSIELEDGVGDLGTPIISVSASSVGAWGQNVSVKVEDATDGDANHFNLSARYNGVEVLYENLDTSAGNDNLALVIGDSDGRFVTVTKLADGRPSNNSAITSAGFVAAREATTNYIALGLTLPDFTTVVGSDGTLAATDYTATGRAWDQVKSRAGVSIVSYAEDDATIVAAINAVVATSAAASNDRMFVIWNGVHAAAVAAVASDAANYRSDRIIYAHNSPKTLDVETGLKISTPPTSWMCSILSQTDVDIHPGWSGNAKLLAGISELEDEGLTRENYISLRDAGVCGLEKNVNGYEFVSGVTTLLTAGKTEITRRRMADFLQLSASTRLQSFVKVKNTEANRSIIRGELVAFSQSLKDSDRIIEEYEIIGEEVNTAALRAQGIEKVLWRVRLIGHILFLQLETEIGTGVLIETTN